MPLWFHPGEKWAYGPSVDVQAFLVERFSGQKYGDYVQQHVLDPLRMRETRYFLPESDRGRFAGDVPSERRRRVVAGLVRRLRGRSTRNHWALTPGSYGLTSTLDDYMRFARMLLGGGTLDGVRVLKPETVKLMATSHLSDSITERSWLPSKGQVGFGIDFAVRTRPTSSADENHGIVGEFFWDGAASTLFWVDPTNQLAAVLFVQLMPFDRIGLHKGFRDAVYGPYQSATRRETVALDTIGGAAYSSRSAPLGRHLSAAREDHSHPIRFDFKKSFEPSSGLHSADSRHLRENGHVQAYTPTSALENAKREAKRWLKALRDGVWSARSNEPSRRSGRRSATCSCPARERGFAGWNALEQVA